jgi:hypothetical protein
MANAGIEPPKIETYRTQGAYTLKAEAELDTTAPLQLALTAVIEETNGRKSYWALAHAPGNPDFHDIAGFTLDLPKAEHA